MSNKIMPEERERIINEIKAEIAGDNYFSGMELAYIFGTDYELDKSCWQRLLDLIESAPVPVNRNMKATELADKMREFRSGSLYEMIEDTLGLSHETSAVDDAIALENAIRSLDAPEHDAKWPLPLDSEGVQIKPGDTVYFKIKPGDTVCFEEPEHAIFFKKPEYKVDYVALLDIGTFVRLVGSDRWYSPELLSHKNPRTLDDVKKEAHDSHSRLSFGSYEDAINDLIDEAYEIGKASRDEQ